jgi:hypothetical protein
VLIRGLPIAALRIYVVLLVQRAIGSGNFYKQVGKEWRECYAISSDVHTMVTGVQLATRQAVKTMPLPPDHTNGRIAWYKIGFLLQIIAILRASLEAWVPVGYEDDSGFHYGPDATGWFFSI